MAPLDVVSLDLHEDSARQSVIELLISAFHEDPGFKWVLGSEQGSDGQYLRYVTWVLRLAAHVVPAVGGMALGALSEEALLGVALLLPPGVQLEDAGLGKLIGPEGPVGNPPFKPSKETQSKELLAWARAARRRDRAFGRAVGEMHRAVASMPHWYLWFLGVHPDAQGQGVGAALLAEIQQIQDRDWVPCYLETSRWTNVQIYLKKNFKLERDFAVLAKDKQGQIVDRFDLDGGMHAMIRFPNSGAAKL
ncbi:pac [Symbiodinium microadriaticum]|nr:pac [Symbiodinium microadriaticum]